MLMQQGFHFVKQRERAVVLHVLFGGCLLLVASFVFFFVVFFSLLRCLSNLSLLLFLLCVAARFRCGSIEQGHASPVAPGEVQDTSGAIRVAVSPRRRLQTVLRTDAAPPLQKAFHGSQSRVGHRPVVCQDTQTATRVHSMHPAPETRQLTCATHQGPLLSTVDMHATPVSQ